MKKIAELNVNNTPSIKYQDFRKRLAVRSILEDALGNIALAYVSEGDYYKIPGGGVDEGEDMIEALKRECLEEAGVAIKDIKELGYVRDINSIWGLVQESFCYHAKVDGSKGKPRFTSKEKKQGFELHWIPLEKAIDVMTTTEPQKDTERHLKERDLLFVKDFLKYQKIV